MKDSLKKKDAQEPSTAPLALKIIATWWMYPMLIIECAGNHPKITAAFAYLMGVTFYAGFWNTAK